MSWFKRVDLATNDLGRDAWGRPKVINDFTLFSALWTFSVPNRVWIQHNDTGVGFVEQSEIDNNLVKSSDGYLQVTGTDAVDVSLISKRHPRYQPNKGLLYSTAVIIPNPAYVGNRQFGLLSTESGVFFDVAGDGTDWTLSVTRRTTVGGVTTNQTVDITNMLPDGFDISKGHVYDIQMEWRGVGNFMIYVDLKLVYTFSLLGTLTGMSVSNPALHVGWRCLNAVAGNDLLLIAGCVDVTSEGGHRSNKAYTSCGTQTTLMPTTNSGVAILAVRLPTLIDYGGNSVRYTRDMILTEMSTFCKDEAYRSMYMGRLINVPNLEALAGWSVNSDSLYEYRTNVDGALDIAFQLDKASLENIFSVRAETDIPHSHKNPDPNHSDFYITGGDILVVELLSDGASTGGVTLEFSEEL